jgi:hypothetical protein
MLKGGKLGSTYELDELLCSDPCQVEKTGNYENIF